MNEVGLLGRKSSLHTLTSCSCIGQVNFEVQVQGRVNIPLPFLRTRRISIRCRIRRKRTEFLTNSSSSQQLLLSNSGKRSPRVRIPRTSDILFHKTTAPPPTNWALLQEGAAVSGQKPSATLADKFINKYHSHHNKSAKDSASICGFFEYIINRISTGS